MDQELIDFLNRYINLTDLRNQEDYNPVMITLADPEDNTRELLMIASYHEPTFEHVPYNVLWLVSNPTSLHYQKLFRRVSDAPSADFKYSWDPINAYSEIWTEDQYYDSVPQDLRDHGITSLSGFIGPASLVNQGLVLLSDDDGAGVAVSNTDPRNSDSRYPNEHTHPDYPRTTIKVNDFQYGRFDQSIQPQPGMIPMLTELNPANPLEWGIVWRYPVFNDIVQIDRSLVSIEIVGPSSVDEKTETDYIIRATFADGAVRDVTPSRFYGDRNEISTVDGQTLRVFNTIQAEQIVLKAEYSEDGVFAEAELTVTVVLGVQLASLRIQGPLLVNENSSAVYAFIATMTDGTEEAITPDEVALDNYDRGSFNTQGILATNNVTFDQPLQLSANYERDGIRVSATRDITVVDTTPYPVSMEIVGPQTLSEGEQGNYITRVTYSDGQIVAVDPLEFTSTDSTYSTLTDRQLDVGTLTEDQSTDLFARYVDAEREVTANYRVNFINLPPVLTQVVILGPNETDASITGQVTMPNFMLREEYDDGTTNEFEHGSKYDLVHVAPGETIDGRNARVGFYSVDVGVNLVNTDFAYNIEIANLDQISADAVTAPLPFVVRAPRPLSVSIAQSLIGGGSLTATGTKRFRLQANFLGGSQRFNWDDDPDGFIPPLFDVDNGDYSTLPQRAAYIQMPADTLGVNIQAIDYTGGDGITYRYIDLVFPNDMGPDPLTFTIKFVYVKQITLTDGSTEYSRAVLVHDYEYTP